MSFKIYFNNLKTEMLKNSCFRTRCVLYEAVNELAEIKSYLVQVSTLLVRVLFEEKPRSVDVLHKNAAK